MSIVSPLADSVRPNSTCTPSWQAAMRRAIRDPAELCRLLELPHELVEPAREAAETFGLFVPLEFLRRIERGNPRDPLLRQVLPLGEELAEAPGFTADPVGDLASQTAPGLLHKYQGRALLVVTGACPVHCRYCFRRHFPYGEGPRSVQQFAPALDVIASDKSIEEVIFSGGDPLTVVDDRLAELADAIAEMEHIKRLRIHTRMPIMIPQRVTGELLDWLTNTRLSPVVVVHANHANEIDEAVAASLTQLADAGDMLLNQSVLLRGVNDYAAALIELSKRLLETRVLPYYLHQLDRVTGASHFQVSESTGCELIRQMQSRLPGYAVPRYVREDEGALSKTPLQS